MSKSSKKSKNVKENSRKRAASNAAIKKATDLQIVIDVMEGGYQKLLYKLLASSFAVCLSLISIKSAWRKFGRNSFWDNKHIKPKIENEEGEKFRLILQFLFSAEDNQSRDRVSKYARALRYMHRQGHKQEEIAELLDREGGIEGWISEARQADEKREIDTSRKKQHMEGKEKHEEAQRNSATTEANDTPAQGEKDTLIALLASGPQPGRFWTDKMGRKLNIVAERVAGKGPRKHWRIVEVENHKGK